MTSDRRLKGRLLWVDEVEGERVDTLARFVIELGDFPIWPAWGDDESDLEIFVDDLLAYLTDCWDVLLLRQTFPFPLDTERPSLLRASAERAAARGPRDSRSEELLAAAVSFSQVHDLSRCFGGLYELPAFWMVRQERYFLLETADRLERVSLGFWIRFATELGDEIAERLIERAPAKWQSLVNSWHDRDVGDPVRIAALATGQSKEVADRLIKDGLVPSVASVNTAANDNDELRVAARMAGGIPYAAIKTVLSAAKAIPHRPSQTLEALGRRARDEVTSLPGSAHPHEQGVYAARWVRREENLDAMAKADPLGLLSRHSVRVIQNDIGPATLDALAIWGPQHGPAVIFNLGSQKLRTVGGRPPLRRLKVLAAHELCHLLLDYESTVAAVDILGGRMPVASEQRANAFAAEFLLPAQTAVALWRESELTHSRNGVDTFLNRVSDRFDVSRLMAAWQLDHGLAGSSPEIVFWLDELFPSRGGR